MERGALLKSLSVKPDRLAPGSQGARMLDELERHLADNYWSWATDVCLNLDDSKPVSAMPVSADTYAWRLAAHFRQWSFQRYDGRLRQLPSEV